VITPDYNKEPWKHPACWGKHLVSHTRAYPDGQELNVATCQCGWSHRETVEETAARFKRAKQDRKDPHDDAAHAHWRSVIAEAEARVVDEQNCPGHVASERDPKICGRCGTHIDSLRPPETQGDAA
jgi:hypothetical protein